MVLGGTGAGKTTLLNTLVTYCMEVQRDDDFRYTIVDERGKNKAFSVTTEVTEYFIEEREGRCPPILIFDTPGFGDTSGASTDEGIYNMITTVLKERIDQIHAVCFVGNSTLERLTPSQNYIMQKVVKLFGKNVARNFVTMATFCDGGRVLLKDAMEQSPIYQSVIK